MRENIVLYYIMKYGRKSMKYRRKRLRTKHKTRKNKSRMMKSGGAMINEKLRDKIADLNSRLIFSRGTRDGFKEQRDGCRNELNKLKEENKILKKEKGDLEIKFGELKEELEKKSKIMKVGGANSRRNPVLPTPTSENLKNKIKQLVKEQAKVKKERDDFRNERDKCYQLNQLKEEIKKENEILKENNKKLEREITSLIKKIQENSVVKPNLSTTGNMSPINDESINDESINSEFVSSNTSEIIREKMIAKIIRDLEKELKEMKERRRKERRRKMNAESKQENI